jgi:hypothetical protein
MHTLLRSLSLRGLELAAAFAIVIAGCDSPDELEAEDVVEHDTEGDSGDGDDDLEFRWSTPLPGVETLVTSANAQAYGQNPGCWDTSPSGSPRVFQQYPCHARDNQRWLFEPVGNAFRIHSVDDDDLCLDVPSNNFVSGQDLQLFPCHNGANQLWRVFPNGDGETATIRPPSNLGLCMDVEDGIKTNQSRIQIFTCHGGSNQSWRFHDYLDDDTVGGCNGSVRFYSVTPSPVVGPGGVGNFPVTYHRPDTLCSADFDHELVQCPTGTDWLVVDRLGGTGSFKVRCFDTKF